MNDLFDVTAPPSKAELQSALAEQVVRWIRDSADVGVRKDEMVLLAREEGFFSDGTPDDAAKRQISLAVNSACETIEEHGNDVVVCDPKGGASHGYRHRLASDEEEAFQEKERRTKKTMAHLRSTVRSGNASMKRFGESPRFYGSNEETIRMVWDRAARNAFEDMCVLGSAWLTPNEQVNRAPKPRPRKKVEENQNTLL